MASIKTPFFITPGGGVAVAQSTDEMVKQQIIDVLMTQSFERVMRPNYGVGVSQMLFEMVDELVFGEFRTDAVNAINAVLSSGAVIDIKLSDSPVPLVGDDGKSTLDLSVLYRVNQNELKTLPISIAFPSEITEEMFI